MEDKIWVNEEFLKRYVETTVLPWERRGELLDKLNKLDRQLDVIDYQIQCGSEDYASHYELIDEIESVNKQLAETFQPTIEEADPFGPADGQDNQDYDNLDYENDNVMYEQLRRGEG